jgi:heptosyltransferase-3
VEREPAQTPSFLIVCLRYIGDVLLSTPLALSITTHLPGAQVDYLVFKGTEGVLAKNPHVRRVHTLEPDSSGLATLLKLWRRYDYSIGTGWSDRTGIFCFAAGREAHGFCALGGKDRWKRWLLEKCLPFDGRMHMVPLLLTQLESLHIPAIPRVVMGYDADDVRFAREQMGETPYVLLHPYTRQLYKYWPASAWAKLAKLIRSETGVRAVFTRSRAQADEEQFQRIQKEAGGMVDCFAQPFTWTQLAAAIRESRGLVGVDTAATHVAAALGVPTVAIYGSTPASLWGPWPSDWAGDSPFKSRGSTQVCGRVTVLQQSWPCAPCNRETCHISNRGKMECLEDLPPERAFEAIRAACVGAEFPQI